MALKTIQSSDFQTIAQAISTYANATYTGAARIVSTGLVTRDVDVDGGMESRTGTIRYFKYNVPTINIASESDSDGVVSEVNTDKEQYIKTVRTYGLEEYLVSQVLTQNTGMDKAGENVADFMATTRDNSLWGVLDGVSTREALTGVGQVSPDAVAATGFHVDLGSTANQAFYKGTAGKLFDEEQTTPGAMVSPLLAAISIGFKDRLPPFMYLVTSPGQLLKLRQANVIDTDHVTDGNVQFETILSGLVRLVVSRTKGRDQSGATGVTSTSDNTSYIVLPGAIALNDVDVRRPIAFSQDESKGLGSGKDQIWARTGYIIHPRGYNWNAVTTAFPGDAGDGVSFYNDETATRASSWESKAEVVNKMILPIYHAA